jgi:hypothetical protein
MKMTEESPGLGLRRGRFDGNDRGLYDFGISPDIQLPDLDTVYDVTPVLRAKLGLDSSS